MALAFSLIGLSVSAAWVCACVAALLMPGAAATPADSTWAAVGVDYTVVVLLLVGAASFALTLASSLKRLQESSSSDT